MSRMKKWSELEGQPLSFDVNSTTEEAMQDTDHPSRIHMTTDGRVVMNGVILGDRNPQRGKWDGRVVINKAVPCYARAGMAYYFSDGTPKFKFTTQQIKECVSMLQNGASIPTCFKNLNAYLRFDSRHYVGSMDTLEDVQELLSYLAANMLDGVHIANDSQGAEYATKACVVLIKKDGHILTQDKLQIKTIKKGTDESFGFKPTPHSTHYEIDDWGRIRYVKKPNIKIGRDYNIVRGTQTTEGLIWYKFYKCNVRFNKDNKYVELKDRKRVKKRNICFYTIPHYDRTYRMRLSVVCCDKRGRKSINAEDYLCEVRDIGNRTYTVKPIRKYPIIVQRPLRLT